MLRHLHIQNYALIKHLDIDFNSGFSVLTGETGAGKSIILGALSLVMGAKADLRSISDGEDLCVIEAEFCDYLIRRELHRNGRSRSFVNDEVVSQQELRSLAARLVDIHSQHANLLLSDNNFQISITDAIAGNEDLRAQYSEQYTQYVGTANRLKELQALAAKTQKDADYIAFQFKQLDEAQLVSDELQELEQEQYQLEHAEEIGTTLAQTIATLDDEERGVIRMLRSCKVEKASAELQQRLDSAIIDLKDILSETEQLNNQIEINPQRLQQVDDRLDLLNGLLRKHGVQTIDELIALRDQLGQQMEQIDSFDEQIAKLQKDLNRQRTDTMQAAKALSESRKKVLATICQQLEESCRLLGIVHAHIEMDQTILPDFTENGIDDIAILFAANLGQQTRRISEVASGGEISRVMLSIKAMIASTTGLPTIIFDEIDTGVSGEIANQMGRMMQAMSGNRQIIAITHLPQIAAKGLAQYRVYKQDTETHTETHIRLLSDEERIADIAGMLSGRELTPAAIETAKQLINGK